MAALPSGMELAQLKKLLKKSRSAPVSCAMAQGDGKTNALGLLVLHHVKQPKALVKDLEKQFPDAKNPRFGTAFIAVDEDPKQVNFFINRPISGMARKLAKTLKGTGYSKVQILLEDGTAVDVGAEEEEEGEQIEDADDDASTDDDEDGDEAPLEDEREEIPVLATQGVPAEMDAPAPTSASATTDEGASDVQPTHAVSPNGQSSDNSTPPRPLDGAELTAALTELVKRMLPIIAADSSQQDSLKGIATQAQASLKAGDLDTGAGQIETLRTLLDRIGKSSVTTTPAAPEPREGGATPVAKARLAWLATRQKVNSDIGRLHGTFTSAFKDHPMAGDLAKTFRARVDSVLGALDEALAEKLDELNHATDAGERAKLAAEAHAIIQRYKSHVVNDPTIAALDTNPFTPLKIQATVTTTLDALGRSIG
jgi:hypothetical protein